MKSSSATDLQSVKNAKKNLTSFLKKQQEIPNMILAKEALRIEAEAKILTPMKSGRLENSVRCSVSKSKVRPGLNIKASARHNGYNYAGIQHENTEYKHPIKGRDHYLSIPFYKGVARIEKEFKDTVKYND